MINVKQVHYTYHNQPFDFDLQIAAGSICALMGPSGAGKSTLLALIAGFIEPISGDIVAANESLIGKAPHQRPLAMLFQEHNLFAHLSVRENIGLGLHPGLKLTAEQHQQIERAAQQVGVEELLDRLPEQLSGGQRQRVALARCFVQPHPIWLLDEPFSALDPLLREEMLSLVQRLANERNLTVVMVTHHVSDARAIATDFAFINHGKIAVAASIDQLSVAHPNTELAAFVKAGH
ncbi:thiamine ABC transporter ATP-binding protein [Vibrio panuliri]|uniref:Thiamine ABC transporter, ATP-binding protein n=1 Tax=Vibrio panuliri TaxID=1381081 RepID=A0A1Q9HGT3_9VIBR|nr:thiamine ABC transporter ATP-binding protein [Vibrio panuliri]KAB1459652.1 thiamine ABC transporter ATP-binding protein [Vibrio panuliri]OLQ86208.1 thiamine ABC transporter, ATP-binding protein [Vibrio panuliri]OLQ89143.1 thiamine ABC transporter, ATP-binding protein [Vibrio panuliri]